jgi:hypothetical protein
MSRSVEVRSAPTFRPHLADRLREVQAEPRRCSRIWQVGFGSQDGEAEELVQLAIDQGFTSEAAFELHQAVE